MANPVCRVGDVTVGDPTPNTALAASTGATAKVFCNGIPVVCVGDPFSPHLSGIHLAPTVSMGSPTVFVGGKPLARTSDPLTCGDTISVCSPDVFSG